MSINLGTLIVFLLAGWGLIDLVNKAMGINWKQVLSEWFED